MSFFRETGIHHTKQMRTIKGMFIVTLTLAATILHAESESQLVVKPNRCVTLHQGQTCYQKLTFSFSSESPQMHCLYRKSIASPITCWRGILSRYSYRFEGIDTEQFQVRDQESQSIISTQEVRVAWVYKSKKKGPSGWRLF